VWLTQRAGRFAGVATRHSSRLWERGHIFAGLAGWKIKPGFRGIARMKSGIDREHGSVVLNLRLVAYGVLTAIALNACSKSPSALVVAVTNKAGQELMQPVVQKDASIEAKRMANLLSDTPACRPFRERMIEAGRGSPYEGATQWKLTHTQQDACAAGCCK
jgi:hypothetical protein